jgi:hypothetical protein
MSRRLKIGLIALVVLITILIVWMASGSAENQKNGTASGGKNVSRYTNWDEQYLLSSKQPKGLFHWNALLKLHLNQKKIITTIDYLYSIDSIPKEINPTFMFVGDYFALYDEEVEAILDRVDKGARLFIAQERMDGMMYEELFDDIRTGFYYDATIAVATEKRTYDFTSLYQTIPIARKWSGYKYFELLDSVDFRQLSGYGNLTNSIAIPYGKGTIYLNTTPELFLNYQILTKDGYDYSKTWINEIPKDESIYWLELARYEPPVYDPWEDFKESKDDSYLQFIFQNKKRIIALSLLFSGIILFILFRTKRMQPLIPFVPKKRNMTLIFADTITSIYFNQRNPFSMVKIQRTTFYSIIQKHFHIDLSKEVTDREIESLAQKSNVSRESIKEIIRKFNILKGYNTSEIELTELRKLILNFYRNAGLISSRVQEKLELKIYTVYRNEWISGLMILIGFGLITYGTYYLANAVAIGVLLWPIGMLPVILGLRRLMKPYLSWSNKQIQVFPLIGKEKVFNLEELTSVYQKGNLVQLHFKTGVLEVNYRALNGVDAQQLKRFVDTHNKLK